MIKTLLRIKNRVMRDQILLLQKLEPMQLSVRIEWQVIVPHEIIETAASAFHNSFHHFLSPSFDCIEFFGLLVTQLEAKTRSWVVIFHSVSQICRFLRKAVVFDGEGGVTSKRADATPAVQ